VGLLRNRTTGDELAGRVRYARGILERYVGLLARRSVATDEGLWFERCRAIHTLGMRAAVDVIFLDADGRVLRCEGGVRPGRLVVTCTGAHAVLEMGYGFLNGAALQTGDVLELEDETPAQP
jgi:uncharacterized membrane protein (UPF0127 family)